MNIHLSPSTLSHIFKTRKKIVKKEKLQYMNWITRIEFERNNTPSQKQKKKKSEKSNQTSLGVDL